MTVTPKLLTSIEPGMVGAPVGALVGAKVGSFVGALVGGFVIPPPHMQQALAMEV